MALSWGQNGSGPLARAPGRRSNCSTKTQQHEIEIKTGALSSKPEVDNDWLNRVQQEAPVPTGSDQKREPEETAIQRGNNNSFRAESQERI